MRSAKICMVSMLLTLIMGIGICCGSDAKERKEEPLPTVTETGTLTETYDQYGQRSDNPQETGNQSTFPDTAPAVIKNTSDSGKKNLYWGILFTVVLFVLAMGVIEKVRVRVPVEGENCAVAKKPVGSRELLRMAKETSLDAEIKNWNQIKEEKLHEKDS